MNVEKTVAAIPTMTVEDLKRLRANVERLLLSPVPAMRDAAGRVQAALTAHDATAAAPPAESLTVEERKIRVGDAFRRVPMTETDAKVIRAVLDNPGADSATLSVATGWESGSGWHMHFGGMCGARERYLWKAPHSEERDAPFYCGILCHWSWEAGKLTYTLRPEVAEAFAAMGFKPQARAA